MTGSLAMMSDMLHQEKETERNTDEARQVTSGSLYLYNANSKDIIQLNSIFKTSVKQQG